MQDKKPNNQSLDDDILQCKADLRQMIKTLGRPDVNKTSSAGRQMEDLSNADRKSAEMEDIFLEAELLSDSLADVVVPDADEIPPSPKAKQPEQAPESSAVPADVKPKLTVHETDHSIDPLRQQLDSMKSQRTQLESQIRALLEKVQQANRETDSLKFQLVQEKSTRETLDKNLEAVKLELEEKTEGYHQQAERLEFLEKQMQNAIVLERAKSRLQQEVQSLTARNQQLTEDAAKLKNRLATSDQTDEHIQVLRKELADAEESLAATQQNHTQTQETLHALRQELSVQQQKEAELSAKLGEKEQALLDLTAVYEQLRQEDQRLRMETDRALSDLTSQLKESGERTGRLKDGTEQLRHEYEAFQTQASGEIQMLTDKIDILKTENDALTKAFEELKADHQMLQQAAEKLDAAQERLRTVSEELRDERSLTEKLRREQAELTAAVSRETAEKEALLGRMQAAESGQNRLKQEAEELRQTTALGDRLRDELAEAHGVIEQLKEENSRLGDVAGELETVQRNLKNMDDEFQQAHEFSQKLRGENEILTMDLSRSGQEKAELLARIQTLESSGTGLRNDVEQLRQALAENNTLREDLSQMQREIDHLQDENSSLREQLDAVESAAFDDLEPDAEEDGIPGSIDTPTASPASSFAEEADIPVFNLAEQIMEEHRRSVAGRRQRVMPTASVSGGASVESVIRQYIPTSGSSSAAETAKGSTYLWTDQSLTSFQQEILREIVRKDMEFYSHKRFTAAAYLSMTN